MLPFAEVPDMAMSILVVLIALMQAYQTVRDFLGQNKTRKESYVTQEQHDELAGEVERQKDLHVARKDHEELVARVEKHEVAVRERVHALAEQMNSSAQRVAVIETQHQNLREQLGQQRQQLDRIEAKLDRVIEKGNES